MDNAPSAPIANGVTLVELVIVLLIMGILAAAAAPRFYDSLLYHRVETAARRVKADLERQRQAARLTSQSQTVTFSDPTSTAYTLDGVDDPDHPDQTYFVDLAQRPFQLNGVAFDFGDDGRLSFNGHGAPSRGGSIELTAGNYMCTVELDGTTGDVTRSPIIRTDATASATATP